MINNAYTRREDDHFEELIQEDIKSVQMMPEREVPLRHLDSDYDSIDGVEPFEKIGDVSIYSLIKSIFIELYCF